MRRFSPHLAAVLVGLLLFGLGHAAARSSAVPAAAALPTAFTYQGHLLDGGKPASGSYTMTFRLYNAETGGTSIGAPATQPVAVADGLFTTQLDFGSGAFDGSPRWLELQVGGTVLAPRQALTATPYALYAGTVPWSGVQGVPADLADGDNVGLTSVSWTDVLSRPAGLDDGDDNTTYTAGAGLSLSGTQFSVNTGAVQARVGGSCAVGSSIRTVDAAGAVSCTTAEPRPRFTSTHVDEPGTFETAGLNTIDTIGADGLPFIAYRHGRDYFVANGIATAYDLRVAHCNDIQCSSAQVTTVAGGYGSYSVGDAIGVAIGYDKLPVISFFDQDSSDLLVAHCDNQACTSSTVSRLESGRMSGKYNSVAINGDGMPIISYYDETDTSLKVARCGDFSCTGVVTATIDNSADTGKFTSIALGADGLPVISYYDQTTADLKAAHCTTIQCSSVTTATLDANASNVGFYTSLAIGADGLPVISYQDVTSGDLKVAHCNDLSCSGAALTTVDANGVTGAYSSLAIGADGLPVISYYNTSSRDLMVAHCQTATCSSATKVATDSAGSTGAYGSITIGTDGVPIISYQYTSGNVLKVIHCGSRFCAPYGSPR